MRGAWAWLAWVAMLMLIAQPASAAAMGGAVRGETVVVELCSAHSGGKPVKVELPGDPAPKSDCEKCVHCSTPPAAIATPAPAGADTPTAYASPAPPTECVEPLCLTLAPPRPPGQGPPASHA
jgi:hypothetical protein